MQHTVREVALICRSCTCTRATNTPTVDTEDDFWVRQATFLSRCLCEGQFCTMSLALRDEQYGTALCTLPRPFAVAHNVFFSAVRRLYMSTCLRSIFFLPCHESVCTRMNRGCSSRLIKRCFWLYISGLVSALRDSVHRRCVEQAGEVIALNKPSYQARLVLDWYIYQARHQACVNCYCYCTYVKQRWACRLLGARERVQQPTYCRQAS